MKSLKMLSILSALLLADAASASLVVTSNGFIDNTSGLEWLAPAEIQSVADYNGFVSAGWQVATTAEIQGILTNTYSAFDQSVFDGFKKISNSAGGFCGQATFCTQGWYLNQGTGGEFLGYEIGWIGLFTNPAQTDPHLAEQQRRPFGTFNVTSTIGSYALFGFSNDYSTFMVRAVPLPGGLVFLSSGLLGLAAAARRKYKAA